MKPVRFGLVIFVLSVFFVFPVATHAAWWDFLLPKTAPKTATTATASASTTVVVPTGISGSHVNNLPSIDDLQGQIANLQAQLATAQATIASLQKVAVAPAAAPAKTATPTTAATPSVSGLSQASVMAKVKPAVVFIQSTSTSAGSGTIIDSQGHILTDAHTVWNIDSNGVVIGAATQLTVTLSSGATKTATLVGIDETHDLAVLQLTGKSSSAYLKLNYDTNVAVGNSAYIFSLPLLNGISTGGSGFIAGTITQKTADLVEMSSDNHPLDTGGAMVNSSGDLIGIPNKSTCKVLEDLSTCLKYTITENNIRAVVPKLIAGMHLYKNPTNETAEEVLVRSQLQSTHDSVRDNSSISFAVNSVTGSNTFDYFDSKLGADQDGKIARLYVLKLNQIAENFYQASDFLKEQADDLNLFLIDESGSISSMGSYERATLAALQAANSAKLKEYQSKVDLWSKKKNEYDSYITNPSGATNDYLMAEGAFEESAAPYFTAEQQRFTDQLSGETVNIF